ncbi:NlpC/P60 family protein [Pseudacidovorax intermedius]|uniref:Uncharacterized protein n=1 Tax=Pseudacidovorax intermedius TaxID=433924 RepID=A0A147GQD9_9BURK|nr:NlpC/P60 family protein [Pseudacidovorax intermedius]KTT17970.1 hypothetical protein NS331_16570 [Pseudacidovorax intermedius]
MTPEQFAARAVGVPWVRWRSDWQAMDCFGLIVLYHRHVLSIELGEVPQTDIAAGFAAAPGWRECGRGAGATCFMAWRDGAPQHCGVLLPGDMLLHAEANEIHPPGSVRVTRLAVAERAYGLLRFYRYHPPC